MGKHQDKFSSLISRYIAFGAILSTILLFSQKVRPATEFENYSVAGSGGCSCIRIPPKGETTAVESEPSSVAIITPGGPLEEAPGQASSVTYSHGGDHYKAVQIIGAPIEGSKKTSESGHYTNY